MNKWHKDCGGKIVNQMPLQEGVGFKKAGYCLKCDDFPIVEEDIIFEVGDGKYERLMKDNSWKVMTIDELPEKLERETE